MDSQVALIFILIIVFHVKHYLADFPLQREYMLRKSLPGWAFAGPLAVHSGIHAVFTLIVCLGFAPAYWWLALVDFAVHFVTDRLKSGPRFLGRFNDLGRPAFWNVLGLDQMIHHLTHLGFVWIMVHNL